MSAENKFTYPEEYKDKVILTKWRSLDEKHIGGRFVSDNTALVEEFKTAIAEFHGEIGVIYQKYDPKYISMDHRIAIVFETAEDCTAFILAHGDKFKKFNEAN